MATINDYKKTSLLSSLGVSTGSVDDLFKRWLVANVAGADANDTIPDLWKAFLAEKGYTSTKAYLASKGYTGALPDMEKAAWAADDYLAVAYLLQATFTGANQAIANGETLGPTGSGATYEGYTEVGTLTIVDTGTGSVSVNTNQLKLAGNNTAAQTAITLPSQTTAAGKVFKFSPAIDTSFGTEYVGFLHGDQAGLADPANGIKPLIAFAGGVAYLQHIEYTASAVTANMVFSTPSITHLTPVPVAHVAGGFNASGVPDASGVYGHSLFYYNGSNWELLGCSQQGYTASPNVGFSNANVSPRYNTLDDLILPDLTIPEVFTPTGYALDTSVALSDTFTHVADHFIAVKVTTLPSAGNIDIIVRTDWAIRVTSAGAVQLVEDMDGTPTVRATAGGTAAAGSVVSLRQSGGTNEMWLNGAGKASYTSSTNLTDTAGSVSSLGTGGAVNYIYSLPLTSATYGTALESF